MRQRTGRGVVAAIFIALACSSAANLEDRAGFLWVAASSGLINLDSRTGETKLHIPRSGGYDVVAVDDLTGNVWAASESANGIFGYNRNGEPLSTFDYPGLGTRCGDEEKQVCINYPNANQIGALVGTVRVEQLAMDGLAGGRLWLLYGDVLFGKWVTTGWWPAPVASDVRAFSLDSKRSRLWAATAAGIAIFNADGAAEQQIPFGEDDPSFSAIAYDARSDQVWVALGTLIRKYNPNGTVASEHSLSTEVSQIASDGAGGLWTAPTSGTTLYHLSGDGSAVAYSCFSGTNADTIRNIVADPTDASLWVQGDKALEHIAVDGTLLSHLVPAPSLLDVLRHLDRFSDQWPPSIWFTTPAEGARFGTAKPTLQLGHNDTGVGIDTTTLRLTDNGQPAAATCSTTTGSTSCSFAQPLPDGSHRFLATISDLVGNVSEPSPLAIVIDTIPPTIAILAPGDGAYLNQVSTQIVGSLNEPATLKVDGQLVAVQADGSFVVNRSLAEGTNSFSFVATDLVGNSAVRIVRIVRDTTPPTLIVSSPVNGTLINQSPVIVSGSVSEPSTVELDGAVVEVNLSGSFNQSRVLPEGFNTLSVKATDRADNVTTRNITVTVDTVAPAAPDAARIGTGKATTGQSIVTGSQSAVDPGSIVIVKNPRIGAIQTVTADASGAFVLTILADPADILRVSAGDLAGNESSAVSIEVPSAFEITSPVNGATVRGNTLLVSGFLEAPVNTGVTVNGVVADISGSSGTRIFNARIPIQAGTNSVQAVAQFQDGRTLSRSISVDRSGPAPFEIDVTPAAGLLPLQVKLTVVNPNGLNISSVQIDWDGNGSWDQSLTAAPYSSTQTYSLAGSFRAVVKVIQGDGAEYSETVALTIYDVGEINAIAHGVWVGLRQALTAGDQTSALTAISPESRDLYAQLFGYGMASVANEVTDIHLGQLTTGTAEYFVLNVHHGITRVFVIRFVKDSDGTWRIESM